MPVRSRATPFNSGLLTAPAQRPLLPLDLQQFATPADSHPEPEPEPGFQSSCLPEVSGPCPEESCLDSCLTQVMESLVFGFLFVCFLWLPGSPDSSCPKEASSPPAVCSLLHHPQSGSAHLSCFLVNLDLA